MNETTMNDAATDAADGAAAADAPAPAPGERASEQDGAVPSGAAAGAQEGAGAAAGAGAAEGGGRTLGESLSAEAMHRAAGASGGPNIDLIMNIPVRVQVVLGEAKMSIASLMKLGPGSIVPLNRKVGEPIEVMVNGRLVARGEVVLLEDDSERFGISLTEIVEPGADLC